MGIIEIICLLAKVVVAILVFKLILAVVQAILEGEQR